MEHYLIQVRFYVEGSHIVSQKKYTYKVPKDVFLNIGDEVIVHVPANHKDQKHWVVRIVDIDTEARDHEFQYKWIVSSIDTVSYEDLLVKDKEFKGLVNKLLNRKKNKSLVDQLADVATPEEMESLKKYL